MCFEFVYPYFVDVVEATPPGAAEDQWSCWDMLPRDHHSCCIRVCSSCECNTCETFFLKCSSLGRASRALAKKGYCGGTHLSDSDSQSLVHTTFFILGYLDLWMADFPEFLIIVYYY